MQASIALTTNPASIQAAVRWMLEERLLERTSQLDAQTWLYKEKDFPGRNNNGHKEEST